ncbi:MAG: hypothetical protein IJO20_07470 [Ruminococcus sp.]|nr:hypothetical protein [Ruminococcus sp.]
MVSKSLLITYKGMLNKLSAILMIFVIVIMCCACSNSALDVVLLSDKYTYTTDEEIVLTIENNSEDLVYYSEQIILQVEVDGKYVSAGEQASYSEVLLGLEPKSKNEMKINLKYLFDSLSPGKYRIGKLYSTSDELSEVDSEIAFVEIELK